MSGREFSDEELDLLTRQRHRIVLAELEQEEAMGKSIPRPPRYRDERDDSLEVGGIIPPETKLETRWNEKTGEREFVDGSPGYVPPPSFRPLAWGLIVFWVLVILGIGLLYSCRAEAMMYFLEDERDLGNGYKLCIYSDGITITKPSHQLCPISIEV